MNAQPFGYKANTFKTVSLAFLWLFALLLTACGTAVTPTPRLTTPAVPPESHIPVILGVTEREGEMDGIRVIHKDIRFMDANGDAVQVVNRLVSSTVPLKVLDDPIQVAADEQKSAGLITSSFGCEKEMQAVIEFRIRDTAGNLSEPVNTSITCPAVTQAQSAGPRSIIGGAVPFLGIGFSTGLVLLGVWVVVSRRRAKAGTWANARKKSESIPLSARILALIQPILLFAFVFTQANFLGSVFHEGGHALVNPAKGEKITSLVVHPFLFAGYARPILDYYAIWTHISGPLAGLSIALLVFILLWKRRSTLLLPLLVWFSFDVLLQGIQALLPGSGDYNNLIQITGMPSVLIRGLGVVFVCVGIFYTLSLFPLFGLSPHNRKSLFIVPASFLLQSVLGLTVAHLFVPSSPILQADDMVAEVMNSANTAAIFTPMIGLLLAIIYVTFYRRVYPKLPAGLRTEVVSLSWKALRIPALLALVSVIVGLIIIT